MSDIAVVLILILLALLILRGPQILPRIGAALGHGVREARGAADRKFGSSDDEDPAAQPRP
ncbi:MAG: twin-arginine translocase TatA/TatE family subunit [Chloroflexota bacterium]|nr:twin-arginine translocase TatA/TatE family subunit [Chloroflexota bacterium]